MFVTFVKLFLEMLCRKQRRVSIVEKQVPDDKLFQIIFSEQVKVINKMERLE
jgi:hypothetical protein